MFQRSPNCQERSAREDRAAGGGNRRRWPQLSNCQLFKHDNCFSFVHSPHSLPSSRSSSTPRHGRGQGSLARAPAQDIPDIYWEQAARELDFCTCRKCQVKLVRERSVWWCGVHCTDTGPTLYTVPSRVLPQRLHISSLPNLGFTNTHLYRAHLYHTLNLPRGPGTIEKRLNDFCQRQKS